MDYIDNQELAEICENIALDIEVCKDKRPLDMRYFVKEKKEGVHARNVVYVEEADNLLHCGAPCCALGRLPIVAESFAEKHIDKDNAYDFQTMGMRLANESTNKYDLLFRGDIPSNAKLVCDRLRAHAYDLRNNTDTLLELVKTDI